MESKRLVIPHNFFISLLYLTMLGVTQAIRNRKIGLLVLGRIWKEAVVNKFKILSLIFRILSLFSKNRVGL
jgi:hypothetical protein